MLKEVVSKLDLSYRKRNQIKLFQPFLPQLKYKILNINQQTLTEVYFILSALKEWSNTGTGFPEQWLSSPPWRYLKDI